MSGIIRRIWKKVEEELETPAAYLIRDTLLILIGIAGAAVVLLACKGFEAIGAPTWFTSYLEDTDLVIILILVLIFGLDTIGKVAVTAVKGFKQ